MGLTDRDWSYPSLLLWGLITIISIGLIIAASTSTAAFGTYNAAWDGSSDLRSTADDLGVDHEIALNTTAYESVPAKDTVAIVLSPESEYSPQERARLARFVNEGGTLLIAEDYGPHGNTILQAVGATARFDGTPVRDERYTYRSPAMPVARNVSNHTYTQNVSKLIINHGTVVRSNNATVLVRTSEFAYLDTNGNNALDEDESLERRPIATVEPVGNGQVVTVSDPSMFINAMLDRPGNEQFVQNLLGTHDLLLLDYSHAGQQPPLATAILVLRDSPLFQLVIGLLGLGVITAWARGKQQWLPIRSQNEDRSPAGTLSEEELAASLRARNPDWDEDRILRVIGGTINHRQQEADDE